MSGFSHQQDCTNGEFIETTFNYFLLSVDSYCFYGLDIFANLSYLMPNLKASCTEGAQLLLNLQSTKFYNPAVIENISEHEEMVFV